MTSLGSLGRKRKSSAQEAAAAAGGEADEEDWGDARPHKGVFAVLP